MKKKSADKTDSLRQRGCLNPDPSRVTDELFDDSEFFDPQDLVQVKYEMLRRVGAGQRTVSRTAKDFGFSRPAFYEAQHHFDQDGLVGLVPKKRGPRAGHKLTPEIVDALQKARIEEPSLSIEDLVEMVRTRFETKVHPRTIERALARRKKNS